MTSLPSLQVSSPGGTLKGVRVHAKTNKRVAMVDGHDVGEGMELPPLSDVVPFTTIVHSSYGGPDQPTQQEIINLKDYEDFFDGKPPAHVEFSKEEVVVVAMGKKNTSGYSTEIVSITHMTGGFMAGLNVIHYREKAPSPGDTTLDVITSPLSVVRCQPSTYRGSICIHQRTSAFICVSPRTQPPKPRHLPISYKSCPTRKNPSNPNPCPSVPALSLSNG